MAAKKAKQAPVLRYEGRQRTLQGGVFDEWYPVPDNKVAWFIDLCEKQSNYNEIRLAALPNPGQLSVVHLRQALYELEIRMERQQFVELCRLVGL